MADIQMAPGAAPIGTLDHISAAFKQQFHDSFEIALQKTESILSPYVVSRGAIQGSSFTINDLGQVEMHKRTFADRFTATKFDVPDAGTRLVVLEDYDLYVPVEPTDRRRLTAQVDGPYMQLMVAAANRAKDKLILNAMFSDIQRKEDNTLDSYKPTGATGYKAVPLPDSQIVRAGTLAAPAKLTKDALIQARAQMRKNLADNEEMYILYNSDMLLQILSDDKYLTNADFMALEFLRKGDIAGQWLGFNWIAYEDLPATKPDFTLSTASGAAAQVKENNVTSTPIFTKTALHLGTGQNYTTDVGTRLDLRLITQLSAQMSYGAGRANEKKVMRLAFANQ